MKFEHDPQGGRQKVSLACAVAAKLAAGLHIRGLVIKRFSKSYSASEGGTWFHDTAVRAYRIGDVQTGAADCAATGYLRRLLGDSRHGGPVRFPLDRSRPGR